MMAVPKLRFKDFSNNWDEIKTGEIFDNIVDNGYTDKTVLTIVQGIGTVPRAESGRNMIYNENAVSGYKRVKKNDFIIHLRSFEGGLEKANGDGVVSPAYTILRPKNKIATSFLYDYFHTNKFINSVLAKAVEGIRDGRQISYNMFKWLKIPFTSYEEQKKISDFLTTFDKRITAQKNIVADLEETKKGLLQKIFSQEIRFKDDNGQDYPEWEEKRLGDISYVMRGLTYKPTDVRDDGIRVFRSSNISEDTFIYGEDDVFVDVNAVNIPFVQNGDILITAANGSSRLVGKHSVIHGVLNDTAVHGGFMLLIRSKDSAFINSSMYSSWYKKFVYKFVAGGNGAIGNLKKSDLENVHLFVPCEKEKNKIDDFLSIFDKKITAEKQVLSDLQEMKKGLLQQMFV